MKTIGIILLAIVAVSAAQRGSDSLRNLKYQLDQAKSTLDLATDGARRAKRDGELQGNLQITRQKGESISSINSYTSKHIQEITAEVEKLKGEGKDAKNCLNHLRESLNAVIREVYSGLDNCVSKVETDLAEALRPLETAISTGQRMMAELDSIFPSCFSGNSLEMQTCIAIKLGTANQAIRNYESNVSRLKLTVSTAPSKAGISLQQCGNNLTGSGFSKTTTARIQANKCIEAV